jgi:hypothetical protein
MNHVQLELLSPSERDCNPSQKVLLFRYNSFGDSL